MTSMSVTINGTARTVGGPTAGPRFPLFQTRRGGFEKEAGAAVGVSQRQVEGEPSAHRVADDHRSFYAQAVQDAQQRTRRPFDGVRLGRKPRRGAMPGQVHGDGAVAPFQRRRCPTPIRRGAHEAVQEEHRRTPGVAGRRVVQVAQDASPLRNVSASGAPQRGTLALPHRGRDLLQQLPMNRHVLFAVGADFYQGRSGTQTGRAIRR